MNEHGRVRRGVLVRHAPGVHPSIVRDDSKIVSTLYPPESTGLDRLRPEVTGTARQSKAQLMGVSAAAVLSRCSRRHGCHIIRRLKSRSRTCGPSVAAFALGRGTLSAFIRSDGEYWRANSRMDFGRSGIASRV